MKRRRIYTPCNRYPEAIMVEEMPALGKLSRFAAHRERLMIDMLNHLYPDYRYDYKPYRSEAVRIHIDHVEKLILVVGSIS